jgi:hypothetical protein
MQSCLYAANGFLICPMDQASKASAFPIIEKFEICPPGSWMHQCNIKCDKSIMSGTCQKKQISPFNFEKCKGKDIYYSNESRRLQC